MSVVPLHEEQRPALAKLDDLRGLTGILFGECLVGVVDAGSECVLRTSDFDDKFAASNGATGDTVSDLDIGRMINEDNDRRRQRAHTHSPMPAGFGLCVCWPERDGHERAIIRSNATNVNVPKALGGFWCDNPIARTLAIAICAAVRSAAWAAGTLKPEPAISMIASSARPPRRRWARSLAPWAPRPLRFRLSIATP
jgi:hypothetical protein